MKNHFSALYIIVIAVLLVSCGGRMHFRQGVAAMQKKEWDKSVDYFLKAIARDPENVEYRMSLNNALFAASNQHLEQGNRFFQQQIYKPALEEYEKALEFNPENNVARSQKLNILKTLQLLEKTERQKTDLETIKERVTVEVPASLAIQDNKEPISLEFKGTDIQQILKVLQKLSGIDFIYDETFKSRKISLNVQNVSFLEVLDKIMILSSSFYKVLDARTLLIIPDTPAKRRDFEELVLKTFFLSFGDPEEIQKIIRELMGLKIISTNKSLNSITVRGTLAEVNLAAKIIEVNDKPRGELFIDIEVIEVNRGTLKEYGIELSNYQISQVYQPYTANNTILETATSTIRLNMIPHTDTSDYTLSLPYVNYKLLKYDSHSRIKARPQLRVVDQSEVKVNLGDKVPIPTTSFVPYNTGGPAQQPITSYQMQDIGINIIITPRIHHDGLITLKMKFELSFITSPGDKGLPPTIGNRTVETTINLRDNETSILAGLLRDTERKAMRGFPFLANVPILRDIFSGNKNEVEQTDIILTLTPRIVRFPDIQEKDLRPVPAGTATRPELKNPEPDLQFKEEKKEASK